MSAARFAVIGTGAMASAMMPALRHAKIHVNAVASDDPARARAFAEQHGVVTGRSDLASVLARNDVDAVYIANAAQRHASTAIAALNAGKAVLCEKPMATTLDESLKIVEAASRAKTLFMEGLWTLFLPSYRLFFELARDERLGAIIGLSASFGYPAVESERLRLLAPERGGVLLDRGVYLASLAIKALGPVTHVTSKISGDGGDSFLQLTHEKSAVSQLCTSLDGGLPNSATLSHRRGAITLEPPLIGSEHVSLRRAQAHELSAVASRSLKARLRELPQLRRLKRVITRPATYYAPFGSQQYVPQLEHFIALMGAGKLESDILPLDFSIAVQRVIALASKSNTVKEAVA